MVKKLVSELPKVKRIKGVDHDLIFTAVLRQDVAAKKKQVDREEAKRKSKVTGASLARKTVIVKSEKGDHRIFALYRAKF